MKESGAKNVSSRGAAVSMTCSGNDLAPISTTHWGGSVLLEPAESDLSFKFSFFKKVILCI